MKPFFLYCFLFLLTSCSVLTNAGLEKRHYTKGFYFDRPSHHEAKNQAEKSAADSLSVIVADSGNTGTHTVNPASTSQQESKKNLRENFQHPLHTIKKLSGKIIPALKSKHDTVVKHRFSDGKKSADTTWADVLFELLFRILVVLLALVLISIFPTMSLDLAELIVILILALALFIIYWWTMR